MTDEVPRPAPRTRVVAGVDEAGLGPLLGPLCMGWAAFATPVDSTDDLWRLLQDTVAVDPKRDKDRLIVADSKKVYSRNERGLKRLENTVLAFLSQLDDGGHPPRNAREILLNRELAPDAKLLDEHPWYERLEDLPVASERGALELKAERLRRAMSRADTTLLSLGVRAVPAAELNRSFEATGNKAETVWTRLLEILRHLWDRFSDEGLRVVVDRQGGRWHYGPLLGRGFPDASVRLVTEAPGFSEFELLGTQDAAPGRRMRLAFAEKAEDESFAVALASCLAKYTRELSMRAFNAYFEALQPGLSPTAGYRQDGHRWLSEATEALAAAGVPQGHLTRTR